MYGLEAISYVDGWSMAAVGASIVLTGLSVLSFLISQLHRLVDLFEKNGTTPKNRAITKSAVGKDIPKMLSQEIGEASEVYISFTSQLGNSFQLTDLYQLSNKIGLPHPHISIRNFRNFGILIPTDKGRFSWKSISA